MTNETNECCAWRDWEVFITPKGVLVRCDKCHEPAPNILALELVSYVAMKDADARALWLQEAQKVAYIELSDEYKRVELDRLVLELTDGILPELEREKVTV